MIPFLSASVRLERTHWRVCLLALCLLSAYGVQAGDAPLPGRDAKQSSPLSSPLAIKVYDDRMTIAVAGAPQVYLSGVIDDDAPRRFAELVKSSKIPPGSDVYLNASGADIDAGIALGRALRAGGMSTHLGTPTRGRRAKGADKSSVCTGACAYAYLGGVYRWAPAGHDRFSVPVDPATDTKSTDATPAAARISTYLKDMGIATTALPTLRADAHGQVVWPTADQMITTGLANNGRQALVANYKLSGSVPRLELNQVGRRGEQRLTLQCKPGSMAFTAYSKVGAKRAQLIVRHAAHSYVEVDGRQMLSQPWSAGTDEGARVDHDTLIIDRSFPPNQLGGMLYAKSVGAWISQQNSTLRYGFAFKLAGIDRAVGAFYHACWKYAPWQVKPSA
ncbi:MAG: hypothetical protein ABIU96_04725 [Rhodanobacter sp.]